MEPLWAANTSRGPYQDARLTIDFSNRDGDAGFPIHHADRQGIPAVELSGGSQGEIFTRTDLLLAIWGYGGQIRTRTLDVHLARLRKKLGRVSATGTWNRYAAMGAAISRRGIRAKWPPRLRIARARP
jgi:hypothetical protein